MSVSRSAYHAWRSGKGHAERGAEKSAQASVESCFSKHLGSYGSRRVTAQPKRQGWRIGRHRVRRLMRRLMRRQALRAIQPRSFVPRTTDSRNTRKPAPNLLLAESFRPCAPNQLIVGDLTYLPLREGKWAYLATWEDACTRKVVGWAMAKAMHKELIVNAFAMACQRQKHEKGLLVHSDRGSQHNSNEFKELLRKNGFRQSMSRKNEVLDNAVAESFFSRYKAELLPKGGFDDYEQAFSMTFDYIEVCFNRIRLHSAIQYRTPCECESFFFSSAIDLCPEN